MKQILINELLKELLDEVSIHQKIKAKNFSKRKNSILENTRQAKQYVQSGKLSKEDLKSLIDIDPSSTRKYVGWMAKQWIKGNVTDIDVLKSTIEEFNVFLEKGKSKTKDIYQLKSFKELQDEVAEINKSGEGVSIKDLESDYETIIDNKDLLIVSPHTHEASRKLGLTIFAFRDCGDGSKDSTWCTTHKFPTSWNDYYHLGDHTFYYIKVKSPQMIEKLKKAFPKKWKEMTVTALTVNDTPTGEVIRGHTARNLGINQDEIAKYTKILGIS